MKCRALWLLLLLCLSSVLALENITIDSENFDMVEYNGDISRWGKIMSPLDYGGSHRMSSFSDAAATFTFTGVAVYYISTLWPYSVNTTVTLDGQDPEQLNLTDPLASSSDGGSASSSYAVHWGRTGLANTTHKLVLSAGANQASPYTVVDAFIYTIDNGTVTTTSPTNTTNTTPIEAPRHKDITAVIIGVAIGALTLLIALALAVFCWRRRRNAQRADPWRSVLPPATSDPPSVSQLNAMGITYTPLTPDDTSVPNTACPSLIHMTAP
ncbi:hypothetical protein BDZ89DRAFT_433189 [Hymenopellis radicata]|nr:hypothetical protein BDZ89DRAFT_433189 [Hymenopellis radicata]